MEIIEYETFECWQRSTQPIIISPHTLVAEPASRYTSFKSITVPTISKQQGVSDKNQKFDCQQLLASAQILIWVILI